MSRRWLAVLTTVGLLNAPCVRAQPIGAELRPGDVFEISNDREMSERTSNGSTSSSHDLDIVVERVIAVRDDGVELEFDLPKRTSAQERAQDWAFPVRVFKPLRGPLQLLNARELETRVDAWLKRFELSRADCGRMVFTWNAFRIACDPQRVLETLDAFDLRSAEVREGAVYRLPRAREPAALVRGPAGADGPVLIARMELDPEATRRDLAETDVTLGELIKKPVIREAALAERAKDAVSGTITVTFDMDPAGGVRRRTTVLVREIRRPNGRVETRTSTEVVEQRRVRKGA